MSKGNPFTASVCIVNCGNMEDEEIADSWEDAADSGEMERRLEEKLRISQKERLSSGSSGRSTIKTIMIQDPAAPPPQIRILKRPTSNGSLGPSVTQSRPSPQVKSLAQREAEYAEARKRILGSADDTPQERPTPERSPRAGNHTVSEDTRSNNHVLRQPTGPDGTQGFRQRR